jgi:Tol biopolymer transport system component
MRMKPDWRRLVLLVITAAFVATARDARSQSGGDSSLQIVGRGVVSTVAPEFATTLLPDGSEIYFNRASADRQALRIMTARRAADGTWSAPVVAPFSGTYRDVDPFVAPDGRRLYFSSDRPRGSGGETRFATWYVERRGDGWGPPVDPGSPLNSAGGEVFVSAARDGLLLFTSNRAGPPRVFASRETAQGWETPRPVAFGAVVDAGNPAIAPSGRFAVFVRAPAGGAADLFVSCRSGDGWAEPTPLKAAVNTPFADFAPSIDAAERVLYFTSERPGVAGPVAAGTRPPGDLYRIDLAEAGVRCR